LSDRQGWAFFIGTPKGENAFAELYAAPTKECGDAFVSLRGNLSGPEAMDPATAEKTAEAIKRAASIARAEIERDATMMC
jgi:hypothetical protein